MMRMSKLAPALALAAPLLLAASAADRLAAGRWEEKMVATSASLGGNQLPPATLAEMTEIKFVCISQTDAADPKAYFSKGDKDCSAPAVTHSPGRFSLTAMCKAQQNVASAIAMSGEYSPSSYRFDINADGPLDGQAFKLTGVMNARHLGACDGTETE